METSKLLKRGLLPLVGVGCVLALVVLIRQQSGSAATPSPVAPVPQESRVHAEGNLVAYPDAQVTLSAEVAGRITELRAYEKSVVRKGQVLALLDASEQRAALAEARARVAQAQAQLRQEDAELRRHKQLRAAGVVSVQALEQVQRNRDTALARQKEVQAQVSRLEQVVAKSRIVAPIDGVVIERTVQPGEVVDEGAPLLVIANLSRVRIEVEVDEFDIGRVALGAPVTITAEGFDGQSWEGTIEEIPDAVVDRRLKPRDPGRPVDTRVLRVKVAFAEPTPLKLGQRVEVEIGNPREQRPQGQARRRLDSNAVRPLAEPRTR